MQFALRKLGAVEFVRRAGNGRTMPAFIVAEDMLGNDFELVAKLPSKCFEGVGSLVAEVLGAILAADLGLCVPEPSFVYLSEGFLDSVPDPDWQAAARAGCPLVFGSRQIVGGFHTWPVGATVSAEMVSSVAAAFLFDCAVQNSDRRPENPNCLRRADQFYLIDHELCFPSLIIGHPNPWAAGGLANFHPAGVQIFADALRTKAVDWEPIRRQWEGLSDEQIDAYARAIPVEWAQGQGVAQRALRQIKQARDNVAGIIAEAQRILT